MSSDAVNSIDDTDEALQVAQIVQSTYEAMIDNRNWPHTKRLINLIPSNDSLLPTHMSVPENVKEVISVYYDRRKNGETRYLYQEVKWAEPDDFLRYINNRNNDNTNVLVIDDPSGIRLLIYNDKAPTYYTSFDDVNLVFDSYDSTVDSTLQSNKTQVRVYIIPEFEMVDDHIPDLPSEAFSALVEEAKSTCMLRLKQMQDVKAEQTANRQHKWLSRKAWTVNGGIKYPNYGRGRKQTSQRDPTFRNED